MAEPKEIVRVTVLIEGVGGHRGLCPAARSLGKDPSITRPAVDRDEIRLTKDGQRYTFKTPRRARNFIVKVDQAESPEELARLRPFELVLTEDDLIQVHPTKPLSSEKKHEKRVREAVRRTETVAADLVTVGGTPRRRRRTIGNPADKRLGRRT